MKSLAEARVNVGNAAWRLWEVLPEPKLDYVQWYYGKRNQRLSEALEGRVREGNEPCDMCEVYHWNFCKKCGRDRRTGKLIV